MTDASKFKRKLSPSFTNVNITGRNGIHRASEQKREARAVYIIMSVHIYLLYRKPAQQADAHLNDMFS